MSVGDWQSDGIPALLGLVMCGVLVLILAIRRFHDRGEISRLIPAALLWHCVIFVFIGFWMLPHYSASTQADAIGYHDDSMRIAGFIRSGEWGSIPWTLGTDTIPLITGVLYAPFGGDMYGMLFFSAVLGFCGGLYLCQAFSLWVTPAQSRSYALIVLFLPSFATWTSLLGKDSWIALSLGLAAYGYSSMLRARTSIGLRHLFAGFVILTAIRPHVSVALAAAMAFAYTWGLTQTRRGSIFTKLATVTLLIAMSGVLASVATGYLGLSEVSADSVEANMELHGEGNASGGSAVEIQRVSGPVAMLRAFPRGIVRVLLQPFPWEVNSFNSGLAALENLFILWFVLNNARRLRGLLGGIAREPYLLFSLAFAFLLLFMLSFTPNLGLLSRQRAQLLPFLFVPLVAARTARKRSAPLAGTPNRVDSLYGRGSALTGPQTVGSPHR